MKSILTLMLLFATVMATNAEWKETAPFDGDYPYRHHPVTFSIDGYGYMLTGVGNEAGSSNIYVTSDFYKYDPVEDVWTRLPNFPGRPRGFAYGDTTGGKAYVGFGLGVEAGQGLPLRDLWEYDPETEQWTELAPCPGAARRHPAFIAETGHIAVGMGDGLTGNLKDFWLYTIETNTWEQLPDIPGLARHHPFYFGIDGTVYAGMGHGSVDVDWNGYQTPIYNDWYSWKIGESAEWTEHEQFPGGPRVAGQQFDFNGRGYVISGQGYDHNNFEEGEFWEFNPDGNTWTELEPHPGGGRWAPGAFVMNATVYLYGGEETVAGPLGSQQTTNTMLSYNMIPASVESEPLAQQVFPNPASDFINIKMEDATTGTGQRYRIIDASGKTAGSGTLSPDGAIDVSALTAGSYIMYYKDAADAVRTARFIKK